MTKRKRFPVAALIGTTLLFSCAKAPEPSLREAFRGKFLIGAALNDDLVSGRDPSAAGIVKAQFNSVTAENAMKWAHIHPGVSRYDFAAADRFVEFGMKQGMFIVGHTLIWHDQTPPEAFEDENGRLLGREAMLARMKDHIMTVMGRYRGQVKGWDVVNEALTDEGELRRSRWVETVGEDFIARAFEYARQVDPEAELYYNDFSLDKPAKRDAAVRLVRDLKAQGLRVDAIGIQGHWGWDYPTTENLESFISAVAALGLKVLVTEMDLDVLPPAFEYQGADITLTAEMREGLNPYPGGLPDSVQKKQTERYVELFGILLKHRQDVGRVTFWGVYDRTSWLNDWPVAGRTSYPLLWGRSYEPKPAFQAILSTAQTVK